MLKYIFGVALTLLVPFSASALSCVGYINKMVGAPLVDAEFYANFPGSIPSVGSVVVLHYPDSKPEYQWHVALVKGLRGKCLFIGERNLDGKGSYSERCIAYNDDSIYKFWTPPNQNNRYLAALPLPPLASSNIFQPVFSSL